MSGWNTDGWNTDGWGSDGWNDDVTDQREPQPWDPGVDTRQPPEPCSSRPSGWGFAQLEARPVWLAAGGGAVVATGLGLLVLLLGGVLVAMVIGALVLLGAGVVGAAWLRSGR